MIGDSTYHKNWDGIKISGETRNGMTTSPMMRTERRLSDARLLECLTQCRKPSDDQLINCSNTCDQKCDLKTSEHKNNRKRITRCACSDYSFGPQRQIYVLSRDVWMRSRKHIINITWLIAWDDMRIWRRNNQSDDSQWRNPWGMQKNWIGPTRLAW